MTAARQRWSRISPLLCASSVHDGVDDGPRRGRRSLTPGSPVLEARNPKTTWFIMAIPMPPLAPAAAAAPAEAPTDAAAPHPYPAHQPERPRMATASRALPLHALQ